MLSPEPNDHYNAWHSRACKPGVADYVFRHALGPQGKHHSDEAKRLSGYAQHDQVGQKTMRLVQCLHTMYKLAHYAQATWISV